MGSRARVGQLALLGVVGLLGAVGQGCGSDDSTHAGGYASSASGSSSSGGSTSGGSSGGSSGASSSGSGGKSSSGSSSGSGSGASGGSSSGTASGSGSGTASGSGSGTASGAGSGTASGSSSGAGTGSSSGGDGGLPSCAYTDDASFCACLGNYNCGGISSALDSSGTRQTVFCGGCTGGQWCQPGAAGTGIGVCGGTSPLVYQWQRDKINMLVSIGENDNTIINYAGCSNIGDGRGYTIGQVGFCTGTSDFIVVARCYNDRKPNNELSKYWNALVQINDAYWSTGTNQGNTGPLDAVGDFCTDLQTAAADTDGIFDGCQDDVGDADYMAPGFAHAQKLGLQGVLTLGFLYDTELNFGENDDPGGLGGTATILKRATADYGPGIPTNFAGKAWEESRFLGFIIQERVVEMSGNRTWQSDMDQNATWEAARRLHTATTNNPESGTDLSMTYDEVSAYKAGAGSGPCWTQPPLLTTIDAQTGVFTVSLDMSASATDETKWVATATPGGSYASCPTNPTP